MAGIQARDKRDADSGVRLFVFWQSLVVGAYRSFFYQLARRPGIDVAVAAPRRFKELAFQVIPCAPFEDQQRSGVRAFILSTLTLHVQIVLSLGLGRALRSFFGSGAGNARQELIFFSVAEPYSLTALWHYLWFRAAAGKRGRFICYALQNIKKGLNPVLAGVQSFLFRRCSAIASCGTEQTAVLRGHGYRGPVIDFPLWFDSQRFFPRPFSDSAEVVSRKAVTAAAAGRLRVGYAGLLAGQKGIHDILSWLHGDGAAAKGDYSFFFAGRGPLEQLVRDECEKLRAAGVDVHFLGPMPADDMPFYFSFLDVILVPSRTTTWWKEQFGRIIIEAKACGTVALGSDSGEIPHVIGRPEFIFPEGDVNAMGRIITGLVRQRNAAPEAWEALKDAARQEAASYSDVALASRFADHLRQMPPLH